MTAPDGPQPAEQVVVRISLGRGHCFTSPRMTLDEGRAFTQQLRRDLGELGDLPNLVAFPAEGYPELFVRANRITDIGLLRVGGRRRATAACGTATATAADVHPPAGADRGVR